MNREARLANRTAESRPAAVAPGRERSRVIVAIIASAAPAASVLARPFEFIAQQREVFAEARPDGGVGERHDLAAAGLEPFDAAVAASWIITEPAALAGAEAQQSSTLTGTNISAAGYAFALANSLAVAASASSLFEVRFALSRPTPVAINAIAGGSSSVRLDGPGLSFVLADDLLITTATLGPGEFLLRAIVSCEPAPPSEQVGSFHVALAVVPSPATGMLGAAMTGMSGLRRRRAVALSPVPMNPRHGAALRTDPRRAGRTAAASDFSRRPPDAPASHRPEGARAEALDVAGKGFARTFALPDRIAGRSTSVLHLRDERPLRRPA